jgi:hypothetical protein
MKPNMAPGTTIHKWKPEGTWNQRFDGLKFHFDFCNATSKHDANIHWPVREFAHSSNSSTTVFDFVCVCVREWDREREWASEYQAACSARVNYHAVIPFSFQSPNPHFNCLYTTVLELKNALALVRTDVSEDLSASFIKVTKNRWSRNNASSN